MASESVSWSGDDEFDSTDKSVALTCFVFVQAVAVCPCRLRHHNLSSTLPLDLGYDFGAISVLRVRWRRLMTWLYHVTQTFIVWSSCCYNVSMIAICYSSVNGIRESIMPGSSLRMDQAEAQNSMFRRGRRGWSSISRWASIIRWASSSKCWT